MVARQWRLNIKNAALGLNRKSRIFKHQLFMPYLFFRHEVVVVLSMTLSPLTLAGGEHVPVTPVHVFGMHTGFPQQES